MAHKDESQRLKSSVSSLTRVCTDSMIQKRCIVKNTGFFLVISIFQQNIEVGFCRLDHRPRVIW